MYSLLRNRFGIPGVISIVALVFAMAGGAWAMSSQQHKKSKGVVITSLNQIKPSVQKQLKGNAGSNGAPGIPGPIGAAGLAGAVGPTGNVGPTGDTGADGADGESVIAEPASGAECADGGTKFEVGGDSEAVCNGSPWPAGGTLPPGETETGAIAYQTPAGEAFVSMSFPIPLEAALDPNKVLFIATEGEEEEACPGSVTAPAAAPGYLCVYPDAALGFGTGFSCCAIKKTYTTGVAVYLTAEAGAAGAGAFAVTAPEDL